MAFPGPIELFVLASLLLVLKTVQREIMCGTCLAKKPDKFRGLCFARFAEPELRLYWCNAHEPRALHFAVNPKLPVQLPAEDREKKFLEDLLAAEFRRRSRLLA